jgi:hypothetical protein
MLREPLLPDDFPPPARAHASISNAVHDTKTAKVAIARYFTNVAFIQFLLMKNTYG